MIDLAAKVSFMDRLRVTPEPPWSRGAGLIQILFVFVFSIVVSVLCLAVGLLAYQLFSSSPLALGPNPNFLEKAFEIQVVRTTFDLFSYVGEFLAALLVCKLWRGNGPAKDWGLSFKWIDIAIGVLLALLVLAFEQFVDIWVGPAVGVNDPAESSNMAATGFDEEGMLFLKIVILTIVGPITEEVIFRGVLQRNLSRFGGPVVGILLSTGLFTVVHLGPESTAGLGILWTYIFFMGLTAAIAAAYFNRLGPSIVMHMTCNTAVAYFYFF